MPKPIPKYLEPEFIVAMDQVDDLLPEGEWNEAMRKAAHDFALSHGVRLINGAVDEAVMQYMDLMQ